MDIKKPAGEPHPDNQNQDPEIPEYAAPDAPDDRAELLKNLRKKVEAGTYKTDIQRLTFDLLLNDHEPLI